MAVDTLALALEFVLFVGGARADATAQQVERLRAMVPELQDLIQANRWEDAKERVRSVMGQGWEPSPQWQMKR